MSRQSVPGMTGASAPTMASSRRRTVGANENRYHDMIGGDAPAESISIFVVYFCMVAGT